MAVKLNSLKIDLLPGYVKLRKTLRNSIIACLAATGLVVGGLLMVLQQRNLELETAKTNLEAAQTVVARVDRATQDRTEAEGKTAPISSVIGFMATASKTGSQRAALLDLVRRAIYNPGPGINTIVSSIDASDGQNVTINATVRNPDEYARFLNNLRRASDVQGGTLFKGLPIATGPQGFANGAVPFVPPGGDVAAPIVYPVKVVAKGVLLNPIQLPPDPVAPAATPAPGA